MLSAYSRLTFSLLVIMLETTSSINIFLPMTFAIFTARVVGNLITNSLYDRALRAKNMCFLRREAPKETKNLLASVVMSKDLVTIPTIANMDACKKALETDHAAFPVVNTAGKLVGLIPKNFIIKVLEKKAFYDKSEIDRSNMMDPSEAMSSVLVDDDPAPAQPLLNYSPSNSPPSSGELYDNARLNKS